MFSLNICHPQRSTCSSHASRELAHAELAAFSVATSHRIRVTTATWTHASYDIVADGGHVVGRAAIDELCGCGHIEADHEDTGCTAITFDAGPFAECSCPGHRPQCADPPLFTEVPT